MGIFVTGATGYLGSAVAGTPIPMVVAARRSEAALGWVPEQASYRDGVGSAHREWKGGGA